MKRKESISISQSNKRERSHLEALISLDKRSVEQLKDKAVSLCENRKSAINS